jgi:hypothetical protein
MSARSAMTKYMEVPLCATQAYLAIASLISSCLDSAIASFSDTSPAISLLSFKDSIKSISSRIIPFELDNKSRILSSPFFNCSFPYAICTTSSLRTISTSGISFLTTSPNNCSCNPSDVTVKFMTETLMNISGR